MEQVTERISSIEVKIAVIEEEISIVKAILASLAEHPHLTPEQRLDGLRGDFPNNKSLSAYSRFTEERLQDLLKELQGQLKELQREKNLLQEKELKQMGPSAGNR